MLPIVPSKLSDSSIQKFQDLYFQNFGTEISKEKAEEEGLRLLRVMALLIEYLPVDMDVRE